MNSYLYTELTSSQISIRPIADMYQQLYKPLEKKFQRRISNFCFIRDIIYGVPEFCLIVHIRYEAKVLNAALKYFMPWFIMLLIHVWNTPYKNFAWCRHPQGVRSLKNRSCREKGDRGDRDVCSEKNNKNRSTGSQALSFLRSKEKCTQFEL